MDGITILLDVHDLCSVELCEIARNYYRKGEFSLGSGPQVVNGGVSFEKHLMRRPQNSAPSRENS
jgi:hypothetical protein